MANFTKKRLNQKPPKDKCNFLRFIVIFLSFISLISRIIYCTYATWLTITTFDCIPCANISSTNNFSSDLFISHHSSAVFKTIRSLNIKSDSEIVSRDKRSEDFKQLRESKQFIENYSKFFNNNDFKQRAGNWMNEAVKSLKNDSIVGQNNSESETIPKTVNRNQSLHEFIEKFVQNESEKNFHMFFSDEKQNQSSIEDKKLDFILSPIVLEETPNNANISNETTFEMFAYIPNEENPLIEEDFDDINEFIVSDHNNGSNSLSNNSSNWNDLMNNSSEEDNHLNDSLLVPILLEGQQLNSSIDKRDRKLNQKSLEDYQLVNDSFFMKSYVDSAISKMNVCSEDCAQFLSIELSDPNSRKWATIVITGVLYLYAFVMFSIFMASTLALVDLLLLSTFIEGAKLFAGFILIIIDSFNG